MKTISIITDSEVPLIHLLNEKDYEVIPTSREGVFAMTRREVSPKLTLREVNILPYTQELPAKDIYVED